MSKSSKATRYIHLKNGSSLFIQKLAHHSHGFCLSIVDRDGRPIYKAGCAAISTQRLLDRNFPFNSPLRNLFETLMNPLDYASPKSLIRHLPLVLWIAMTEGFVESDTLCALMEVEAETKEQQKEELRYIRKHAPPAMKSSAMDAADEYNWKPSTDSKLLKLNDGNSVYLQKLSDEDHLEVTIVDNDGRLMDETGSFYITSQEKLDLEHRRTIRFDHSPEELVKSLIEPFREHKNLPINRFPMLLWIASVQGLEDPRVFLYNLLKETTEFREIADLILALTAKTVPTVSTPSTSAAAASVTTPGATTSIFATAPATAKAASTPSTTAAASAATHPTTASPAMHATAIARGAMYPPKVSEGFIRFPLKNGTCVRLNPIEGRLSWYRLSIRDNYDKKIEEGGSMQSRIRYYPGLTLERLFKGICHFDQFYESGDGPNQDVLSLLLWIATAQEYLSPKKFLYEFMDTDTTHPERKYRANRILDMAAPKKATGTATAKTEPSTSSTPTAPATAKTAVAAAAAAASASTHAKGTSSGDLVRIRDSYGARAASDFIGAGLPIPAMLPAMLASLASSGGTVVIQIGGFRAYARTAANSGITIREIDDNDNVLPSEQNRRTRSHLFTSPELKATTDPVDKLADLKNGHIVAVCKSPYPGLLDISLKDSKTHKNTSHSFCVNQKYIDELNLVKGSPEKIVQTLQRWAGHSPLTLASDIARAQGLNDLAKTICDKRDAEFTGMRECYGSKVDPLDVMRWEQEVRRNAATAAAAASASGPRDDNAPSTLQQTC